MSKLQKILDVYFQVNSDYIVRTEQLDGKDHLVVPVTMMVEGVHSGSHGPIFHSAEELGRYPDSWNGIPATIRHPQVNQAYVSANSPDVLADWSVGRVFNARMDGSALKAEAWLCIEDLERISEDTLEMINNAEQIEVSVGVFSDEEASQGTWNSENYNAVAHNHRPDHLALLPDQVGACSLEDGCGIRVNKRGGKMTKKLVVNEENQSTILKELNQKGFSINEMGHNELGDKVRRAVYSLDGNYLDHYVEDVYADHVIYQQYNRSAQPSGRKLFKQSYEIDAADNVVLSGEAVQVKREIEYVPVVITNTRAKVQRGISKKKEVMANNKCIECVTLLTNGLIADKSTAWAESDRETLMAMSEATLEKMTPQKEKVTANAAESKAMSREDILSVFKENPMTQEEFMQFAPKEVSDQLNANNASMVTEILANSDDFEEAELTAMSTKSLTKIFKLATKNATTYAGAGGLGGQTKMSTNSEAGAPMLPADVEVESAK